MADIVGGLPRPRLARWRLGASTEREVGMLAFAAWPRQQVHSRLAFAVHGVCVWLARHLLLPADLQAVVTLRFCFHLARWRDSGRPLSLWRTFQACLERETGRPSTTSQSFSRPMVDGVCLGRHQGPEGPPAVVLAEPAASLPEHDRVARARPKQGSFVELVPEAEAYRRPPLR